MVFTTQRNNLFDCIVNEIEKLNEYHRILTKFSNDDLRLINEYNNDPDLIGFIHLKSYDIITDKMFRAFVNIEQAIVRIYNSVMKKLQSDKSSTVVYTKNIFLDLYKEIDNILDITARGKLYNKDINSQLNSCSFMEYMIKADKTMEEIIAGYTDEDKETTSTEELEKATNRCYEKIKKFLGIMRTQLESRPYYNHSVVVMKNVFYIATMISDVAVTVSIN